VVMRTTLTLADDVQAEVDRLRREQNIGVSDAVNQLARRGISGGAIQRTRVVPLTAPVGIRIDVSNVAEALDLLDQLEEADRAHSAAG